MIVCHCAVIRDHEVRTEVRLGARSVGELARSCGAAASCGGCRAAVVEVLLDELERAEDAIAP